RVLHPEGEGHRGRDAGGHPRRPALQPRQPRGALPDDRPRDLGADEGQGHALRLLARHGGDGLRGRALPHGEGPAGAGDRGGSRGLNVFSALEVARQADDPNAMVVTILCDTGERYLSKLYDDAWMRENQMLESERVTAGQLLGRHPRDLPALVSVAPAGSVRQALNLMSTWGVSQIPVIDGHDCVGSV